MSVLCALLNVPLCVMLCAVVVLLHVLLCHFNFAAHVVVCGVIMHCCTCCMYYCSVVDVVM